MANTRTLVYGFLLLPFVTRAQQKAGNDTTKKPVELKEVQVSAVTKAIETAPGKTILNVQATGTTAGKNVLDVLRQSPGITVDMSGNINMNGKDGVLVTIDGKQTYLSGIELGEYLKGITADEVAQIELITQPSARYDAAGNAGVINIKTRRLRKKGFNGTLTPSYDQNFYHYSTNTALLNYRRGKTNWYTNLNFIDGQNGIQWKQRSVYTDAAGDTLFTSRALAKPVEVYNKYNAKFGADYNYNEKLTAGFFASGGYHTNTNRLINTTATDDTDAVDSTTSIRRTVDLTTRRNAAANAYIKYAFSKTSELNINADYVLNTKQLEQDLTTETTHNGTQLPGQLTLRDKVDYRMQVTSLKADHTTTLKNKMSIESGAKYSDTRIDNDARFDKFEGGAWSYDAARSNHFLYRETIGAVYANSTKKLGAKVSAQVGLRGELADIEGIQQATSVTFHRTLPALFPTLYISYAADSNNSFEVNYGRRVERPKYYSLNPFNNYTFWNTFERGNPQLLPQYSHNAELKHNYKNVITTTLQLSYTRDVITSILVSDVVTQTAYGTSTNTGTNRSAYMSVTYNNSVLPWWDMMVSVNGRYVLNDGVLSNVPVRTEGYSYAVYNENTFKIKKWLLETEFSYSGRNVLSVLTKANPQVVFNIGVSRKFLHDSCTVRMGLNDPLYIYRLGWVDQQPGYYHTGDFGMYTRSLNTAVTYNFGKNAGKKRNYSGPDEARRM